MDIVSAVLGGLLVAWWWGYQEWRRANPGHPAKSRPPRWAARAQDQKTYPKHEAAWKALIASAGPRGSLAEQLARIVSQQMAAATARTPTTAPAQATACDAHAVVVGDPLPVGPGSQMRWAGTECTQHGSAVLVYLEHGGITPSETTAMCGDPAELRRAARALQTAAEWLEARQA